MDEQQPELRWAPLPPAPKRTGRIWLIVGLVVAALAIVGALLFFLLPREGSPVPEESTTPTPTVSPSATPTPSPSPSASPSASSTPEPSTPAVTPPPAVDPTVEVFRGQVRGWLDDSLRGLDIVAGAGGQDALPVVDTLELDAQRLSDAQPPSSIQDEWSADVTAYAKRLAELRSAISNDSGVAAAVDAARTSAQKLRGDVGL